jgi:hypothetical protein
MAVPPFHLLFPHVLRELAKHPQIHIRDLKDLVIASLELSPEEAAERVPGGASRIRSRVGWAVTYLVQAGAIERPSRGILRTTGFGTELLAGPAEGMTKKALDKSAGISAWSKRSKDNANARRSAKNTVAGADPSGDEEYDIESELSKDDDDDETSFQTPVVRPTLSQIYTVTPQSIETILAWVKSKEIAIPEIQRPFVWERTDVRDLLDSLYSGFPVGYLITWKNPTVRLKSGGLSSGRKILIDGQQRVTALMTSLLGEKVLNDDYEELRMIISFNPLTEEIEVANAALKNNPFWIYDVADVFTSTKSTYTMVKEYCEHNKCDKEQEERVAKSLGRLEKIKNNQIGIIELDQALEVEWVQEIFKRVNSQGKKLSQADFAMSKIAVNERYGGNILRKAIDYFCHFSRQPERLDDIFTRDKEFVETPYANSMRWLKDFTSDIYDPSYTDMLRVAAMSEMGRGKLSDVVALLSGRNFETKEYEETVEEQSFAKLAEGVKRFINQTQFTKFVMIVRSAGFISSDLISSQGSLNFGYILYLRCKQEGIDAADIERLVRRWFVFSLLTGRYSGSFESQYDQDLRQMETAGTEQMVKTVLESGLTDGFWDGVLPQVMDTSAARSPYWNAFRASQVFTKAKGFLSTEISTQDLIDLKGDVHHIYPKGYLKAKGYKPGQYNQIANLVQMQTEINIKIGAKSPQQYFATLDAQVNGGPQEYGGITSRDKLVESLNEHALPLELLDGEIPYEDFLVIRRKLMAEVIRKYFEKL